MPEKINKKKFIVDVGLVLARQFWSRRGIYQKNEEMCEYIFWDWRKETQWRCHWGWHDPMGEKIIYFVDTTRMEFFALLQQCKFLRQNR